MFAHPPPKGGHEKHKKSSDKKAQVSQSPQAAALNGAVQGLQALFGKIHGDMPFAKRELAWGKLNCTDIDEISKLFRGILTPLIGMRTVTDIFERIAERRGWTQTEESSAHLSGEYSTNDSIKEEKVSGIR